MTDARYPGRWLWDLRLVLLSDAHHRAYVTSLALAVENRTDGLLTPEALRVLPGFDPAAPAALVAAGLWEAVDGGWLVSDFAETQTSAAALVAADEARRKARDKKRRQRAHPRVVPGDVQRDVASGQHQAKEQAKEQARNEDQDMNEYDEHSDGPEDGPAWSPTPAPGYVDDGWGGFIRADLATAPEEVAR